jgi:hypothetical protein
VAPTTGYRLTPPRFLRVGDRLRLSITSLGEQVTAVIADVYYGVARPARVTARQRREPWPLASFVRTGARFGMAPGTLRCIDAGSPARRSGGA